MDSPSFLGDLAIPYASLCSMFLFGATKWILLYVSYIYEFHAVGSWLTTKFYVFKNSRIYGRYIEVVGQRVTDADASQCFTHFDYFIRCWLELSH